MRCLRATTVSRASIRTECVKSTDPSALKYTRIRCSRPSNLGSSAEAACGRVEESERYECIVPTDWLGETDGPSPQKPPPGFTPGQPLLSPRPFQWDPRVDKCKGNDVTEMDAAETTDAFNEMGRISVYLFDVLSDPSESNNLLLEEGRRWAEFCELVALYLSFQSDSRLPVVDDLSKEYGVDDPAADPATHPNGAWGPFRHSSVEDHQCEYR